MSSYLNSLHIFGDTFPADYPLSFCSFSPGWLSCTDPIEPGTQLTHAKKISLLTGAPVLLFFVDDRNVLSLFAYCNGKMAVRYDDSVPKMSRGIYSLPAMFGYASGEKKRLSTILRWENFEEKIALLEEYFGVCLAFWPELLNEPERLFRARDNRLFLQYTAVQKQKSVGASSLRLRRVATYPGKLFLRPFGGYGEAAPHYYLWGYRSPEDSKLLPYQFEAGDLWLCDDIPYLDLPSTDRDSRFIYDRDYRTVTFSAACSPSFRGKTTPLPDNYFPVGFAPSGELVLSKPGRVLFLDDAFQIVTGRSVHGEVEDCVDGYLLTTVGDSFFGYGYDPNAKIHIYAIETK